MTISLSHLLKTRKKAIAAIGIGLGVLLLGFFLLLFASARKSDATGWKKASAAAPQELVARAIAQNFTPANSDESLDPNRVSVFVVGNKPKLYIFNFNTPSLCGIAGCTYAAYTEKGEPVLRLILQPSLPDNVPLFAVSDAKHSDFPCLVVSQPVSHNSASESEAADEQLISKTRYCYSGNGMARFNNWIESKR